MYIKLCLYSTIFFFYIVYIHYTLVLIFFGALIKGQLPPLVYTSGYGPGPHCNYNHNKHHHELYNAAFKSVNVDEMSRFNGIRVALFLIIIITLR